MGSEWFTSGVTKEDSYSMLRKWKAVIRRRRRRRRREEQKSGHSTIQRGTWVQPFISYSYDLFGLNINCSLVNIYLFSINK